MASNTVEASQNITETTPSVNKTNTEINSLYISA